MEHFSAEELLALQDVIESDSKQSEQVLENSLEIIHDTLSQEIQKLNTFVDKIGRSTSNSFTDMGQNNPGNNPYEQSNLPPINRRENKYVTFSVNASKDFRMSLVKKSVNRLKEKAPDTLKIKEVLSDNLAHSSPIELYSTLYSLSPEVWSIYRRFRKDCIIATIHSKFKPEQKLSLNVESDGRVYDGNTQISIPDPLNESEISQTLQLICRCIEQEVEAELEVYIENEVYILPITIQEHLFSIFLTILLDFMITCGYITEEQKNSMFKHNEENDLNLTIGFGEESKHPDLEPLFPCDINTKLFMIERINHLEDKLTTIILQNPTLASIEEGGNPNTMILSNTCRMVSNAMAEGIDQILAKMMKDELDHCMSSSQNSFYESESSYVSQNFSKKGKHKKNQLHQFEASEDNDFDNNLNSNFHNNSERYTVANSVAASDRQVIKLLQKNSIEKSYVNNIPEVSEEDLRQSQSPRIYMSHSRSKNKEDFKNNTKKSQKYTIE
ncbi:unnamed protein product [Moneuplotes crassus]|uniref:Uncharacterized protein n=1 Tax=Euplotes crassus TaxID=5936 RepID=A0AAD1UHQ3_EUPCR|nr:unnamed protein product [Moneuplotes crassus]